MAITGYVANAVSVTSACWQTHRLSSLSTLTGSMPHALLSRKGSWLVPAKLSHFAVEGVKVVLPGHHDPITPWTCKKISTCPELGVCGAPRGTSAQSCAIPGRPPGLPGTRGSSQGARAAPGTCALHAGMRRGQRGTSVTETNSHLRFHDLPTHFPMCRNSPFSF